MAADGKIVLGLDISKSTSEITSGLNGILDNLGTKQIIIKTAIEKAETEKSINSLMTEINSQTAEIGIQVDEKDISKVLSQQQKIASVQNELIQQMEKYKQAASDAGLTLSKVNTDAFEKAINTQSFDAAKESIRAVKKEIEQFNQDVKTMNDDFKLDIDITSIKSKIQSLKTSSSEVTSLLSKLETAEKNYNNATTTSSKLDAYKQLRQVIAELTANYSSLKQAESASSSDAGIQQKIANARTYLKVLQETYKELGDSSASKALTKSIEELEAALNSVGKDTSAGELSKIWDEITTKIAAAKRAVTEYKTEQSNFSQQNSALDSIIKKLEQISSYELFPDTSTDFGSKLNEQLQSLLNKAQELQTAFKNVDSTDTETIKNLQSQLEQLKKDFADIVTETNRFGSNTAWDKFKQKVDSAIKSVEEYDQKYSAIKGNPDLVQQLEKLKEMAKSITTEADLTSFNRQFAEFDKQVQSCGLHTKSLSDRFAEAFKNFSYFFSASRMIYQLISSLKEMVSNVIDLNTAMVELRKVTEATDQEFNTFLESAKSNAVELGSTVTDLVNATADFSRLGYSLSDAEELGKIATIYLNVGDDVDDISQATTSLVSTMKGFGIEAEDAMSIIDKFNEVGNNFAISSGGIGDALQRSAASLAAANNSIDESIALIVAANNVIQDPETVGTMWKTVAMRIRGATTELEAAGLETDGMAKSTSDLRDQIMALTDIDGSGGFDIMADEETFKSTYDIILGIGEVWQDIADVDQAALLELLAGKRQGNALAAALTNLEDLQSALETSADSAGSAMEEQEIWLESLEAKINQFQAAFESLSSAVFSDDFLGFWIDRGTDLIQILEAIIEKCGGMGNTLTLLISIIALLNISSTTKLVTTLFQKLSTGFGVITKVTDGFQLLKTAWAEGKSAGGGFISTLKGTSTALYGTQAAATVATIAITALVAIIAIAVAAYKNYQQKLQEQRDAAIEAAQAQYEEEQELRDLLAAYDDADSAYTDDADAKATLESATDSLLAKLGYEEDAVDGLITKYGDLDTALRTISIDQLKEDLGTYLNGLAGAEGNLLNHIKDGWTSSYSVISGLGNETAQILNDAGLVSSSSFGTNYAIYLGDNSTIEGALEMYQHLLDMKAELTQAVLDGKISSEDLNNDDLWNDINAKLNDMQDYVEAYQEYLGYVNDTAAAIQIETELLDRNVPKTVDEYNQLRQDMIDEALNSDVFIGSEDDIVSAIDSYMQKNFSTLEGIAAYEEKLATEIQQKKSEIIKAYSKSDDIQDSSWKDAEKKLQEFNDYIDGLSNSKVELAYDLVVNTNIDSLDELKTAIEASDITDLSSEKLKEYQQIYDDYKKVVSESRLLGVDLSNTIYGNIDTNNRQILEWTDENLATYQSAIESWGSTIDELRGSFSTVFGGSEEFDGVEIAFSPILQTENGAVLLDKDTVYEYIYGLIDEAGENWTSEDLLRLDTEGLEMDGQVVKNLLADIGETAIWTGEAMHFTGDTGAVTDAYSALSDAADEAGVSVEALIYYLQHSSGQFGIIAGNIKKSLTELWSSDDFADTKTSIIEMANTLDGINVNNIDSLVDSSADLAAILDEDGMNAKFLAHILQTEAMGGDGFALITEDALTLNSALEGLKTQFQDVTDAKSRYDEAMSVDEKDTDFKSYAEAFEELNDQFVAGTTNSNAFWAAAEFLFGSDQLQEWGWSDGLDEIYEAMKKNVAIFEDADSAGAGFLDRLYELSEAGEIKADDGTVIATIEKLADGSYDFNFDSENLDLLADKMGITKEAALACMEALSMYGDFQFYDIEAVMNAVEQIGLASDSIDGTAVNVETLTDQLISLGYTNKEIYDLLQVLQQVDGVTLLDAEANVDDLVQSLNDLGLAVGDGVDITVNADALSELMSQLNYTKEDTEGLITKLGEADNITLTNAQGQVIELNDALDNLNNYDFATVTDDVNGLNDSLEETDDADMTSVTSELDGIKSSAELAQESVDELQKSISTLKGKTVTLTVDVKRKSSILGSLFGYASGTKGAPGGESLVGEEGEELIQSGDRAYLAGTNGPEIVDLDKGDVVYTAEETKKIKRDSKLVRGVVPAFAGGTINTKKKYDSVLSTSTSTASTTASSVQATVDATKDLEEELEDTLKEMQETIDEIIDNFEHTLFLMEHNGASNDDMIKVYQQMQQSVHDQAEAYRKLGLDENSDYIQDLQEQWWDYYDKIKELNIETYESAVSEYENAITLTENWLNNAISDHDYDGIVQYTSDTVAYYKAMQEKIHEEAEYYRSLGYSDTSDEVSKLSDLWWDYYDKIKNASADAWQEILDDSSSAVDQITGLYDTLKDAAQDYAENGNISVSILQDILSYGVQYLAYLQDENGQLVINEENIQKVIAARTEQLALENALSYIQQIRVAMENNDIATLNNLLYATETTTSATWDLVYAQLQLLGLDDDAYNAAVSRINALRTLTDSAVSSIGRVDSAVKESLQETSDALDDILKYVEEMIKQEVQNQIDALEDQIDSYKEIVDLQKKSLALEQKKDSYTKSIKEKTEELAEIQKQLALLELDDSRESIAKQTELRQQMAEISEDLADKQADYAYDATSDMLDDMADAYEAEKKDEISVLEDSISSEEKLYQLAINRINNEWDSLYQDLIDWNYEYGSNTEEELTSAWAAASQAVQEYGSYLNAVAQTQAQLSAIDTSSVTTVGTTTDYDTSGSTTLSRVKSIVREMKENSEAHHSADAAGKKKLNQANLDLGAELQSLIGRVVVRGDDGVWYLDKVGGAQLYATYPYSTYHTGGVVGDDDDLHHNEVLAKLEKRELVLTEEQQGQIAEALDFTDTMFGKYGSDLFKAIQSYGGSTPQTQVQDIVSKDTKQAQNVVNNSGGDNYQIDVPVQVYPLQKLDDSEIKELTSKIGTSTIERVNEMFYKNGMTSTRAKLKP